jgi:uncharacterized membrane protein YeaQ/YmgE (transglycosylase-associated protein family)
MGILAWIVFGLIAGALGKYLMPGDDPGGCIVTSLLGICGAVVGGFIGTMLGLGKATSFDIRSMFLAILGTVVLLALYRLIKQPRGRS